MRITGFPRITVPGYSNQPTLFNGGTQTESTSYSHSANFSLSWLAGRHTVKVGGEYRRIGMRVFAPGDVNGTFGFSAAFTQGPNPTTGGTNSGDALASLLLGYPATGAFNVGTRNDFYTNYFAGFVQDDFRWGSNVSINVGVRYELEPGLRERNNAMVVGFDRDRPFPIQAPGLDLRGGLMYAGVDGYPEHQGDPSTLNFGPRAGIAWSLDPKTVVRGGYGLFWAPPQIAQAFDQGALGTRGFTATTTYTASTDGGLSPCSGCSLTNPFPTGIASPQGAAEGLLTGVGGDIDFIDQSSRSGYVHQYSIDVKRELTARMSVSVGYLGSRSERLALGGTIDTRLNINQLDPRYFSLGNALQELVPNPFFGIAEFGARSRSATIARGELLRPYPQFTNVYAHRVNAARSRYNALSVGLERRHSAGWSGRVNYVFSVRKDNQVGEGNAFSINAQGPDRQLRPRPGVRLLAARRAASPQHQRQRRAPVRTRQALAGERRLARRRWPVDGRSAAWAGTRVDSPWPWFNPTTTSTCSAACSGPTSSLASTRASPAIRRTTTIRPAAVSPTSTPTPGAPLRRSPSVTPRIPTRASVPHFERTGTSPCTRPIRLARHG